METCEICGEREAKHLVRRMNYSGGEIIIKDDRICPRCLAVYKKWKEEGRILELTVWDI